MGQCVASVVGEAPGLRVESMVDIWYMQSISYKGNITFYVAWVYLFIYQLSQFSKASLNQNSLPSFFFRKQFFPDIILSNVLTVGHKHRPAYATTHCPSPSASSLSQSRSSVHVAAGVPHYAYQYAVSTPKFFVLCSENLKVSCGNRVEIAARAKTSDVICQFLIGVLFSILRTFY